MTELIFTYIITTLIVGNLISILEVTSMKIYLLSIFVSPFDRGKIYTIEDFNDYIVDNWGKVGELLSCPLCYGTWLSLIISAIISKDVYVALLCMFSCPFLAQRISLVH